MPAIPFHALVIGLATYVPGLRHLTGRKTGGTGSARYCYSIWLRHLRMLNAGGLSTDPDVMVELGPGDSLGVGLAALLSGVNTYIGLDAYAYPTTADNLLVLDELIELFQMRASIGDQTEFPRVHPVLPTYDFPDHILSDKRLARSLSPARIAAIREALILSEKGRDRGGMITYRAPWSLEMINPRSVDMVLSQGVMQFVHDLPGVYRGITDWLKPGGVMSHEIALQSIGLTREWNGHWACSEFEWRIAAGRRRHVTNRQPHSTHLRLMTEGGCKIVTDQRAVRPSCIARSQLAARFSHLSDEDLETSSALIQGVKIA